MPQDVSSDDSQESVNYLKETLSRAIKAVAHETTAANAAADADSGVLFARVPQGVTTCPYCLNIASYGYVFPSRRAAGEFTKFHRNCDCAVVASWSGQPSGWESPWQNGDTAEEELSNNAGLISDIGVIVCEAIDASPDGQILYSQAQSLVMARLHLNRDECTFALRNAEGIEIFEWGIGENRTKYIRRKTR